MPKISIKGQVSNNNNKKKNILKAMMIVKAIMICIQPLNLAMITNISSLI